MTVYQYMKSYIHANEYVYTCTSNTHSAVLILIYIHVFIYTHIYTCINMYLCLYIHINVYIYIYICMYD
jgi:hypothetical protein